MAPLSAVEPRLPRCCFGEHAERMLMVLSHLQSKRRPRLALLDNCTTNPCLIILTSA